MGRPRKHQSPLPPCYLESHGAFFHVKRGKWRRVGTSMADVAADYAKQVTPAPLEHQLDALIDASLERMGRRKNDPLAPRTVRMYASAAGKLKHHLRAFSRPDQVKQRDVAMLKNLLLETPGMANLVLTVGQLIWGDFLELQLIDQNPFIGVKRNRQNSRKRTYTWEEWNAIRAQARPLMQLVMDGCYLLDQRIGDVLKIAEPDLVEAGIYVKQQKTRKELIVAWNDDLRAWVAACKAAHGKIVPLGAPRHLLRGPKRKAPAYNTVYGWWVKACAAAGVQAPTTADNPGAHMHDGRAFSAGEAKRQGKDPQSLLGHELERTTNIYLRGREVPVVAGPTMRKTA